jgi:ankyrin repeat protein
VKNFLKLDSIDVNGKDDKGRTLLTMALFDLSTLEVVDFVKFLILKGANVNTSDLNGDTPLHLLANYTSKLSSQERSLKENVDKEDDNLV